MYCKTQRSHGWLGSIVGATAACLLFVAVAAGQGNRASVNIPAGGHLAAPAKPSFTDPITSTFKKGWAAITAPLNSPPPPVRGANDPTSLQSEANPSVRLHVEVGRLAEQAGKLDEAEMHYRRALEAKPEDLGALLNFARLRDRQHKLTEAYELYRRAAEKHPNAPQLYNSLGLHYDRRGMSKEAAAAFSRAVQLAPTEARYRNNLAYVLVELNQLREAFGHLKVVHGEAVAYYNLGYLLHKQNRTEAAIQHLQMAIRKDAGLSQAHTLLAQIAPASRGPGAPARQHPTRQYVRQRPQPNSPAAPADQAARVARHPRGGQANGHVNGQMNPRSAGQATGQLDRWPMPDGRSGMPSRPMTPPAPTPAAPGAQLRQPGRVMQPSPRTYPGTSPRRYPELQVSPRQPSAPAAAPPRTSAPATAPRRDQPAPRYDVPTFGEPAPYRPGGNSPPPGYRSSSDQEPKQDAEPTLRQPYGVVECQPDAMTASDTIRLINFESDLGQ